MERNRVWTSDDLRVLHATLGNDGNVEAAAKYLEREPAEVKGMACDLGWIESPPLAPDDGTRSQPAAARRARQRILFW
jgi:hypothetical protein